jgi:hypothetical protein
MARLPQAMLAKGALAVVGHVDRAWGYSFNWPRAAITLSQIAQLSAEAPGINCTPPR